MSPELRNMLGVALLVCIALWSWLWSRQDAEEAPRGAPSRSGPLGYYLSDAEILGTDENGRPLYRILAGSAEERPDEDRLMDWTPELRAQAMELVSQYRIGGSYMPWTHVGNDSESAGNIRCDGGLNIPSPAALDPTTGIMYVPSGPRCGGGMVMPGAEADIPDDPATTGTTISEWVAGPGGGLPRIDGLPVFKPPYRRLSAYDMNTGERIWWVPTGQVDESIRDHPALQGVDTSEFGGGGSSLQLVAGDLLITEHDGADGPAVHGYNKLTGEKVGEVPIPGPGQYGMMTYMHEGRQYVSVQVQNPARLVTLSLP